MLACIRPCSPSLARRHSMPPACRAPCASTRQRNGRPGLVHQPWPPRPPPRTPHYPRRPSLRPLPHPRHAAAGSAASIPPQNPDNAHQQQPPSSHADAAPSPAPLSLPAVPWGLARVFQIMALWLTSFYAVGTLAFPMLLEALSISQASLSTTGQAVLYLLIDAAQLVSSFLILAWCARQHGGFRLAHLLPFRPRALPSWLPLALLSTLTFPLIDYVAHRTTAFFPLDPSTLWSANIEQSVYTGEWGANAAYIATTLVCAPIWEEAIFRGFLLTSLAALMPTLPAALLSSTLFALFHFKLTSFLPLLLLGLLFSANYIRSRDIGAPILLHSFWNLYLWLTMALRGML